MNDMKKYLRIADVMDRTGLSRRTIARLISSKELPVSRIGAAVLVDPDDLRNLIESRKS